MKQKPRGRASSSEQIIRDIKRKTRKQYGAEERSACSQNPVSKPFQIVTLHHCCASFNHFADVVPCCAPVGSNTTTMPSTPTKRLRLSNLLYIAADREICSFPFPEQSSV